MYLDPLRARDNFVAQALCGAVQLLVESNRYPNSITSLCTQAQEYHVSLCSFPPTNQQCTGRCAVAITGQSVHDMGACQCPNFLSICPTPVAPGPPFSSSSPSQPLPPTTSSNLDPVPAPTSSDDPPSTSTPTVTSTSTSATSTADTESSSESLPSTSSIGFSSEESMTTAPGNTETQGSGSTTSTTKPSDGPSSSNAGRSSIVVSSSIFQYETTLTISGSVVVETRLTTSVGTEVMPTGSLADTMPSASDGSGIASTTQGTAQHHKNNVGAIVGGILAAIVLLILGLCLYRRRQRRKSAFAPSFQFMENSGPAIVVTSPAGIHDYDARAISQSKANLLGIPTSEALPAYTAPGELYDGIAEKKDGPPVEEDGGYGVGYGHPV